MPSHAHCVVPGARTGKTNVNGAFFPSQEKHQDRRVYVKRLLCGSRLEKVGCRNQSQKCKLVSFFHLPKDGVRRRELRKIWLANIPGKNTSLSHNSYICAICFPSHHPDRDDDSPVVFLGKPITVLKWKSKKSLGMQSSRGIPYLQAPTTDEQGWWWGKKRNAGHTCLGSEIDLWRGILWPKVLAY